MNSSSFTDLLNKFEEKIGIAGMPSNLEIELRVEVGKIKKYHEDHNLGDSGDPVGNAKLQEIIDKIN